MPAFTRLRLPQTVRTRLRGRMTVRVALLVIATLFVAETVRVVGLNNRHTVVPGRVYRCAQPSESDIRELVGEHGIRTIINLRGLARDDDPKADWYFTEARVNHELDVSQEDITFSASRLPPPAELRRLIDVLDHTEYPVLIHCKAGADRTGLTATAIRLLYTDDSLAVARHQLWPRYGHFRFGRTAAIDQFFDRYENWLAQEQETHSPDRFRRWATTIYSPGPARSELVWLDEVPNPIPAGEGFAVRLRAVNRSTEPWEFQPGDQAGIHLSFLIASGPSTAAYRGKAGLFRATIPPGEHVDFTIAVPPLRVPGRYALAAEMIDARGSGVPVRANSFVQFGDAAVLAEVVVE